MKYQEVLFERIELKEGDTLKVNFKRTRVIKDVELTQQEADILNAGKLTHPGNLVFSYLLKEGESDPAPLKLRDQKANKPV